MPKTKNTLPVPKNKERVIEYYKQKIKEKHGIEYKINVGRNYNLNFSNFSNEKITKSLSEEPEIDFYILERSLNKLNVACNKLWSTLELYYHLKDPTEGHEQHFKKFDGHYVQTSTLPVLYYSLISSIMSIMEFYGVGFFRKNGKGYNFVRRGNNLDIYKRKIYLNGLINHIPKGFHNRILKSYKKLKENGVELPNIDLDKCFNLKNCRETHDYKILAESSLTSTTGKSDYFKNYITVKNAINKNLNLFKNIFNVIWNKVDIRFNNINEFDKEVFKLYGKEDVYVDL